MSRQILILPDDTSRPILDAIRGARRSLRLKMFVFSDPDLLEAVLDAHKRGVLVRVMLNPARRDGQQENAEVRAALLAAGVAVLDSNPAFDITHEKSLVIDDETAFIKSLNWEPENFTETRDYAIITTHQREVAEIIACFEADWSRKDFSIHAGSHLIWCIGNGRQRIGELIDGARHSLWVQNERYQDPVIIEHLVRAALRGVKVRVIARPPHKLKKQKLSEDVSGLRLLKDAGAKVHKLKHLKPHAKLVFADEQRAIIGSINLAPGSFDSRRELAILVDDKEIVTRLTTIVHCDWGNSHPLDLTDEGLRAELEAMDPNLREDLAL